MSKEKKKRKFSRRKFLIRSSIGVGVLMGTAYISVGPFRRFAAAYVDEGDIPYSNNEPPNIWFEITAENQILFHSPQSRNGTRSFYRFGPVGRRRT